MQIVCTAEVAKLPNLGREVGARWLGVQTEQALIGLQSVY